MLFNFKKKNCLYIIIFGVLLIFTMVWFYFLYQNKDNIEDKWKEGITQSKITTLEKKTSWLDIENWKNAWEIQKIIDYYENKPYLLEFESLELAEIYLDYANYFYKENEFWSKAQKILFNLNKESFKKIYLLWYSYEITKDYEQALDYYNQAKKLQGISEKEKAIILNQIGHVYDLQGKLSDAYREYYNSYIIDKNIHASVNIARYLIRQNDYEGAIVYFNYVLSNNPSMFLQAEIYFSIASLYIEQKKYLEAIEFARKSINANKNYPMGHYILAKSLYLSDKEFDYETLSWLVNISIQLNKNNSQAYELSALIEYENTKDLEKTQMFIQKAIDTVEFDILLMDDERSNYKIKFFNQYLFLVGIAKWDLSEYMNSKISSAYPIWYQSLRYNKGLLRNIELLK